MSSFLCKYCESVWLKIDPLVRSRSGKCIPVTTDTGEIHDCDKSPYNRRRFNRVRARAVIKSQIEKIERFDKETK